MDDFTTSRGSLAAATETASASANLAPDLTTAIAESAPEVVEPETTPPETTAPEAAPNPHDLATQMVAKLCHDFISPAGAIMSGLDLLDDPSAQDMRQEALNLISASAKKMVTLVHFARVAFGASNSAESFAGWQLKKILGDVFSTMRAQLDFAIDDKVIFPKAAARALLNLALIAGNALPTGGTARIEAHFGEDGIRLTSESRGPRARLKPEAVEGLRGLALGEGLNGQWIQPHWLYATVKEARGTLDFRSEIDALFFDIFLPA